MTLRNDTQLDQSCDGDYTIMALVNKFKILMYETGKIKIYPGGFASHTLRSLTCV